MKKILTTLVLSLFLFGSLEAQTAYDKTVTKDVMKHNYAAYHEIEKLIDQSDFLALADAFYDIAKSSRNLLTMNPPKGDKATWDKIASDMVSTALRGVGACGERDLQKVKKVFEEIKTIENRAHSTFL